MIMSSRIGGDEKSEILGCLTGRNPPENIYSEKLADCGFKNEDCH